MRARLSQSASRFFHLLSRFVILSTAQRSRRPYGSNDRGAPSFARSLREGWEGANLPLAAPSVAVALLLLCLTKASSAQDFPSASSQSSKPANSMVAYLFPEQISIPANKPTAVELHFRIGDGLHINSHTPREKSLIPTNFAAVEESALKVTAVDFPAGIDYAFDFDPKEKLSVYTGEFTLRAHLAAPAGQYLLQGLLRYQACDSRSCFPPKNIPVAVNVTAK